LDPGPGRLRSIAGAVVLGAAFHPVLQHMGIEIKMQAMERRQTKGCLDGTVGTRYVFCRERQRMYVSPFGVF